MAKTTEMPVEGVIIFVILVSAWFNIFTLFLSTMKGEMQVFLSFVLALLTYRLISRKALKIFN